MKPSTAGPTRPDSPLVGAASNRARSSCIPRRPLPKAPRTLAPGAEVTP